MPAAWMISAGAQTAERDIDRQVRDLGGVGPRRHDDNH